MFENHHKKSHFTTVFIKIKVWIFGPQFTTIHQNCNECSNKKVLFTSENLNEICFGDFQIVLYYRHERVFYLFPKSAMIRPNFLKYVGLWTISTSCGWGGCGKSPLSNIFQLIWKDGCNCVSAATVVKTFFLVSMYSLHIWKLFGVLPHCIRCRWRSSSGLVSSLFLMATPAIK